MAVLAGCAECSSAASAAIIDLCECECECVCLCAVLAWQSAVSGGHTPAQPGFSATATAAFSFWHYGMATASGIIHAQQMVVATDLPLMTMLIVFVFGPSGGAVAWNVATLAAVSICE